MLEQALQKHHSFCLILVDLKIKVNIKCREKGLSCSDLVHLNLILLISLLAYSKSKRLFSGLK